MTTNSPLGKPVAVSASMGLMYVTYRQPATIRDGATASMGVMNDVVEALPYDPELMRQLQAQIQAEQ